MNTLWIFVLILGILGNANARPRQARLRGGGGGRSPAPAVTQPPRQDQLEEATSSSGRRRDRERGPNPAVQQQAATADYPPHHRERALAGDQEKKRRSGAPYDPCRGLDCASFERMKTIVKKIHVAVARKYGKELSEEAAPSLFGDVAVTEATAAAILGRLVGEAGPQASAIEEDQATRWPNPINYYFEDGFPELALANLRASIEYWQSVTCLNFTRITDSSALAGTMYMKFQRGDAGCYAYIGAPGANEGQIINMGEGCDDLHTGMHEIGHSLGLHHEQQRSDRDDYITINTDAISEDDAGQFSIAYSAVSLDTPYDYGSGMHYGLYDFSKDYSSPAMSVKVPGYDTVPGQESRMSFYDVKTINLAYNCANNCPGKTCQNYGIPNPRDCSTCLCPEGFGGDSCQDPGPMSPGCSPSNGTVTVTSTEACVSSPEYPSLAPQGASCNWILKTSDPAKRIAYYFKGDFSIPTGSRGICNQWVELKDGQDLTLRGIRACGSSQPNGTSFLDTMVVSFDTFYPNQQAKFQLCYTMKDFDPCDYSPCANAGNCTTVAGGYNCSCAVGYSGTNCTDFSACVPNPCKNKGVCGEEVNAFNCTCKFGWLGKTCEIDEWWNPIVWFWRIISFIFGIE